MYQSKLAGPAFILSTICFLLPANADTFSFSTGNVTGSIASASRPASTGKSEIESADDFVTTGSKTSITSATFTGLLTGVNPTVGPVTVEIYRVFPNDSDVGRTSGPPTFSTSQVPTRVNSPSDVQFGDPRSSALGNLSFTTAVLSLSFTAANSIQAGGINSQPGQTSGGNGPVTGQEVLFSVNFTVPIDLPPDHYFFVPQVDVAGGEFLWLSGTRPNSLFPTGFPDLQSWARDEFLDPDWLRIGTDIVGIVGGTPAPTFNAAFSLNGVVTPLPGAMPLFATGLGLLGILGWRRKKKAHAA